MTVRTRYPVPPEPAIASYSFTDIADGSGVIEFFAGDTFSNGTRTGKLSTSVFHSDKVLTNTNVSAVNNSPNFAINNDVDFDIELTLPRIIDGTAIISIPFGIEVDNIAGDANSFVQAKIRKVSGGVETDLATVSGAILNNNSPVDISTYMRSTMQVDIPRTKFISGDILRLTVEQYHSHNDTKWSLQSFFRSRPKRKSAIRK